MDDYEYSELEYEEVLDPDTEVDEHGIKEVRVEELLISCVEARPPLWDCRLSLMERSKTIRDQLWIEIYREFGELEQFSIKYLMGKWRNLRDTYVRVKGELESYKKNGSSAKKKKIWEYFETMSFLRDTLTHRVTTGNVAAPFKSPPVVKNIENPTSATSLFSKGTKDRTEMAIINAIEKINQPLPPTNTTPTHVNIEINPICKRISDLLHNVPSSARTVLEIKLLQVAYGAKNYLDP